MPHKVREAIQVLEADGWRLVRQRGSHRIFRHPGKRGIVVIPGAPGKDIAAGTWRSVVKQAQIEDHP